MELLLEAVEPVFVLLHCLLVPAPAFLVVDINKLLVLILLHVDQVLGKVVLVMLNFVNCDGVVNRISLLHPP